MDNFVNYNISINLNNSLLKDVMRAFPGITFVEGYLKTMEIIQKDILSIYRVINALDLSNFIVALENLSQSFEAAIDTLSLLKDEMRAFPGITFVEGYLKTMEIIQKDILSIYRVINALDLSIFIVALENLSQSFEAAIDTLPEAISGDIKRQVELMRDRIETKQFCNCYQKEAN